MKKLNLKSILLTAVAVFGFGACAMAQDTMDLYGNDEGTGIKQPSFGWGEFPMNCKKSWLVDTVLTIYSDELKIAFSGDICSISGDTLFVQGIYTPAPNEYPDGTLPSEYNHYGGFFCLRLYYSDSSIWPWCLNDKQCQDINLQITCESDFATGKHWLTECSGFDYSEDSLAAFWVKQLLEFDTPCHDFGEGTVTITWTGFDGTPRQHVFYFIIDDHFYIDYYVPSGIEEQEGNGTGRLNVYPVPAEDKVMLEAGETILSVEVYNSLGQCVLRDSRGGNNLYVGGLANGLYLLKAETPSGNKYGKLIKK